MNFAYVEDGERKNALVKLRLCPECSGKLNFHSKKRLIKKEKKAAVGDHKQRRKTKKAKRRESAESSSSSSSGPEDETAQINTPVKAEAAVEEVERLG